MRCRASAADKGKVNPATQQIRHGGAGAGIGDMQQRYPGQFFKKHHGKVGRAILPNGAAAQLLRRGTRKLNDGFQITRR